MEGGGGGPGGKAAKAHRKKTKGGGEKKKRKAAAASARASGGGGNNPKAFVFKSRGKAKLQRVRSGEKEQKRLHGAFASRKLHPDSAAELSLSTNAALILPSGLPRHLESTPTATHQ